MSKVKKITITALFIALCVILPIAFHSIANAGSIFLPMYLPVLLCGMICGWPYGLVCGLLGPVLSTLFTGMPPMAILPGMMCDLAVEGFVIGLLTSIIHTGKKIPDLYLPLICAMLSGRVFSGVLNALIFRVGKYSLTIWLTSGFVTALPGLIIQLALIPILVYTLEKARLIERNTRQLSGASK